MRSIFHRARMLLEIWRNMGATYVLFRVKYGAMQKMGLQKRKFPVLPSSQAMISLHQWRASAAPFFFEDRNDLSFPKLESATLAQKVGAIFSGNILFFSAYSIPLGYEYDWVTNPQTGYHYDAHMHWTDINDFSKLAGDIKFVWEKSRFSYLYSIIRYDYHHGKDSAAFVFGEIDSWLDANPLNCGPNYKCSQEISLRLMTWIFVLYFYRNSPHLTEVRFQKIIRSIHGQLCHVYNNIEFSRIAVRNNHAITETLMLYIGGALFPSFEEAQLWKSKGKAWFEEEIAYQIYDDGTFLQFSHNYHRVVVQLLSWAFYLGKKLGEEWRPLTYEKARRTLHFLTACMAGQQGELPNYGANDGALFFPLTDNGYPDFRPQLNALSFFLNGVHLYEDASIQEEANWYSNPRAEQAASATVENPIKEKVLRFTDGGYYMIRDGNSCSFINCTRYKDRPSQADNLHLDVWFENKNVLVDAGSYLYNTDPETLNYFKGTIAHNTAAIGDNNQMAKGPRFVWLSWTQAEEARLEEQADVYSFYGRIRAFQQIDKKIRHERWIDKDKNAARWVVRDKITHQTGLPIRQYWHPAAFYRSNLTFNAKDAQGNTLAPVEMLGYYSNHYSQKTEIPLLLFETYTDTITTEITIK